MRYRLMRNIRIQNEISTSELARCCGIKQQRLSEIELGRRCAGSTTQRKILSGFHVVLEQQRESLSRLERDLAQYKNRLFDFTEEPL